MKYRYLIRAVILFCDGKTSSNYLYPFRAMNLAKSYPDHYKKVTFKIKRKAKQ